MRYQALKRRRLLLDEALGREVHADALSELAMQTPDLVHAPTLRVVAHSQRVRAMELRAQAVALDARYGFDAPSNG